MRLMRISKTGTAAGLGLVMLGYAAKSAWALYKRNSHTRTMIHGEAVEREIVSEPEAVAEEARPIATRFQRFILAEVRVRTGVPRYTEANLVLVRRAVVSTLLAERPDCRGTDLERHVRVIVPLVFTPSDAEIVASQVMNDDFYRSWTWWVYRQFRNAIGSPIPKTPVERMAEYVRPPA